MQNILNIIKSFFITIICIFLFTININKSYALSFNLKEYTEKFTQITNLSKIKNFTINLKKEIEDQLTVENIKIITENIKNHPIFIYIPNEHSRDYKEKFTYNSKFKVSIPKSLHYITDPAGDNYLEKIINGSQTESTYLSYNASKEEAPLPRSSSAMNDLDTDPIEYEEPQEFNPFAVIPEDIKKYIVILTDFGDLFIEIYNISPLSVEHFLKLMKSNFYENSSFYRYIPNYILQGGDPTESGLGSNNSVLIDEFSATYNFERGTIALSNNGNTNSSDTQFFITFYPATWLNGKYNIIGKVVLGLDNFEYNFQGTYQNNGNIDDVIPITNIITLEEFLKTNTQENYNL
jgi:cyclophilin family peptidyl-prolyl cis-trans isomerase